MSDFLPYKESLELKRLGIELTPNFAIIDQTEYLQIKGEQVSGFRGAMVYNIIACPLYQQAFKFFRDKYDLHKIVAPLLITSSDKKGIRFTFSIFNSEENDFVIADESPLGYLTYEEAELECLRAMIKYIKDETKK